MWSGQCCGLAIAKHPLVTNSSSYFFRPCDGSMLLDMASNFLTRTLNCLAVQNRGDEIAFMLAQPAPTRSRYPKTDTEASLTHRTRSPFRRGEFVPPSLVLERTAGSVQHETRILVLTRPRCSKSIRMVP